MNNPFIIRKIKKNPKCINKKLDVWDEKYILYAFENGYTFEKNDIDKIFNTKYYKSFLDRYIYDSSFLRKINYQNFENNIYNTIFEYLNNKEKIIDFLYKTPKLLLKMTIEDIKKYISVEEWAELCFENFEIYEMKDYYDDIDIFNYIKERIFKYLNSKEKIIDFLGENPKILLKMTVEDIKKYISIKEWTGLFCNNYEISEISGIKGEGINELYESIDNFMKLKTLISYNDDKNTAIKKMLENFEIFIKNKEYAIKKLSLSQADIDEIYNKIIIDGKIPTEYINKPDIVIELIDLNNNLIETNEFSEHVLSEIFKNVNFKNYIITEKTPEIFKSEYKIILSSLINDISSIKYINPNIELSYEQGKTLYCECKNKYPNFSFSTLDLFMKNGYAVFDMLEKGEIDRKNVNFVELNGFDDLHNFKTYKKYFCIKEDDNIIEDAYIANGVIYVLDNLFQNTQCKSIKTTLNSILKNEKYRGLKIRIYSNRIEDLCYENYDFIENLHSQKLDIEFFGLFGSRFKTKNIKVYSLEKIIENEKFLNYCVKDINSSNMSPYEKYLAVYDIVKNFKKYKKRSENEPFRRGAYDLLENENIVCLGFTDLLENLLKRVGINSVKLDFVVGNLNEIETYNHVRDLVYLKDEKYNIDGYYISDPTWDNYSDFDEMRYSYVFSNLTLNEVRNENVKYDHRLNVFYEEDDEKFIKRINGMMYFFEKLDPSIKIPLHTDDNYKEKIHELRINLQSKINRDISEKTKLQAVLNNLKYKYKNITPYDIEIIKNSIIYDNYYKKGNKDFSLFEKDFNEFFDLYFLKVKNYTVRQYFEEKNSNSDNYILQNKVIIKALLQLIDNEASNLSNYNFDCDKFAYKECFLDEKMISKILENKKMIEDNGFNIKLEKIPVPKVLFDVLKKEYFVLIMVTYPILQDVNENTLMVEAIKLLDTKINLLYEVLEKGKIGYDKSI